MKILGISAHYHDSAAALVVDGVPVCAVQEERLSRHKNDAGFPSSAIEWCLIERRARAGRSRRGRLLRAQHAEVRADPDVRAAGVSALVAVVSARDQELARREGLGARHHLVAPRRAAAEDPLHRPPRVARRRRVSDRADAARGDPDRRRRRRVGDAHRRPRRRGARRRHATSRCCARSGIPHSLGMLYSTFTAYLGFAVNEDEYKVMGLAAYGRPTMSDAGPQADPAHAGRRLRARARVLRVPDHGERDRIRRDSSTCSGRRATPYEPIDLETAEGRRFADCAASVQRVLEDTLVDMARALHRRDRAAGSVSWRRRRAQRRGERTHPRRVGLRARVRAAGARRCRLRARRRALCRSHLLQESRPRRARSSVLGAGGGREGARAGRARGRPGGRGARRHARWSSASRTISPPAASSAGWTAPRSSARARSVIAASSRRRSRARCATGSIATSSIARSSARSRRSRRSRRPTATSSCRRAARGWHASCRAYFRCVRNGETRLGAITHVDGSARVQALERDDGAAAARAARGVRAAHWHAGAAQHVVQRSRRADRQSRARGLFDIPALRHRRARRRGRRW